MDFASLNFASPRSEPAHELVRLIRRRRDLARGVREIEERRDAARRFVERERNWSSNISRYAPVYQRLTGKA
jgi:hypothetical protein